MLVRNHIETDIDLFYYRSFLEFEVDDMSRVRKDLVKSKIEPADKKEMLGRLDGHLRAYRREIYLCDDVFERSKVMRFKLDYIRYEKDYIEKVQEVKERARVVSRGRGR